MQWKAICAIEAICAVRDENICRRRWICVIKAGRSVKADMCREMRVCAIGGFMLYKTNMCRGRRFVSFKENMRRERRFICRRRQECMVPIMVDLDR